MRRRGRPPYPDVLTPREWEVLGLLREGLSNEEIAERLGITLRTAKFHVSEILGKLGVESREQAASWQPEEAPTPARRWLAWPLAARIGAGAVITTTVGGLALLALAALASGSLSNPDDAEAVVQKALQAVASSRSYRIEANMDLYYPEETWIIDFVRPGTYYVRAPETTSTTGSSYPGRRLSEQVITPGSEFSRSCDDYPTDCGAWRHATREGPVAPLLPGAARDLWPLTAMELSRVHQVFDGEGSSVHVRGEVNPALALFETWHRQFAEHDIADGFGTTCDDSACRPISFEEFIARDPTVEAYDNHPATIDAYISSRDYRPQRIEMTAEAVGDRPELSIWFTFTRFNEITITPPIDFIPLETPTPTP